MTTDSAPSHRWKWLLALGLVGVHVFGLGPFGRGLAWQQPASCAILCHSIRRTR